MQQGESETSYKGYKNQRSTQSNPPLAIEDTPRQQETQKKDSEKTKEEKDQEREAALVNYIVRTFDRV